MDEPIVYEELENDNLFYELFYVACESINDLSLKDNINRIISTTPYNSKNYKLNSIDNNISYCIFWSLDLKDKQFQISFCNKCGNYINHNFFEKINKKCLCLCKINIYKYKEIC